MAEPFIEIKRIEGLKELESRLERLGPELANKILSTCMKEPANYMRDQVVDNAPEETGFLKENFSVRQSRAGGEYTISAFIGPKGHVDYPRRGIKGKGRTISVAAVARFHEFGTSKMEASAFMRAAFYSAQGIVRDKIIARIKEAIYSVTK